VRAELHVFDDTVPNEEGTPLHIKIPFDWECVEESWFTEMLKHDVDEVRTMFLKDSEKS
jgi:hypothetical protein